MLARRLTSLLQVRASEVKLVAYVSALFALIQGAQAIGANAADALFFLRFGVQFLPYMFLALGALTFVVTVSYTAALGRLAPQISYVTAALIFAAIILLERAALVFDLPLFYPALWLSVNVIGTILALQVWHVAGEVTDTRQARRLYAIFISGGIFGSLLGNLTTGSLALVLGTENLLVLCAALLFLGVALTYWIARQFFKPVTRLAKRAPVFADLRDGFNYVRHSRMLLLIAFASVLFSILYFSVSFPFSRIVTISFANEAEVAGFLGLFSAAATALTFIVSLLFANRLYVRLGIVSAVLIMPLVYLGGFILWALSFSLLTAIVVRLAQTVVFGGVWNPAWNALYNVAPSERRVHVLGFDAAVSAQIGTVLSGVLLILGQTVLTRTQIFGMGMVVALACAYLVWQMRRAYGEALVEALRAGRYEVFGGTARAFARFRGDATAIRVAVAALADPRPSTRRLGVEMLTRMRAESAVPNLISTLDDQNPEVRLAAVRALGELEARAAADAVAQRLNDADANVRACALEVLPKIQTERTREFLAMLDTVSHDPEPRVRAAAAFALAECGNAEQARATLEDLLNAPNADTRVLALEALEKIERAHSDGANGIAFNLAPVVNATRDESPMVRRAACETLAESKDENAIEPLLHCLADPDPTVSSAAARALKAFGARATPRLLEILKKGGDRAPAAALDALDADDPKLLQPLHEYARREIEQARNWRELAVAIPRRGRVTKLLGELLDTRAGQSEERLVKTVGLLGHREAIELVRKSLKERNSETRAAAVEALEAVGNKEMAREIIPLLDAPILEKRNLGEAAITPVEAVAHLLAQRDGWLRALAARAAAELGMRELTPNLRVLLKDAEPLPREAAHETLIELGEVVPMETLQTVSSLERILLLREVPLFAELSPDDLKQISDIAREQFYPNGATIFREGDEGNELYVIASGQMRVTKGSNGSEKYLATRGEGECIGEMAIIESAPRSATVCAAGEVRALVIDAQPFRTILRDRPEVSLAVMRVLSRRLRERE